MTSTAALTRRAGLISGAESFPPLVLPVPALPVLAPDWKAHALVAEKKITPAESDRWMALRMDEFC